MKNETKIWFNTQLARDTAKVYDDYRRIKARWVRNHGVSNVVTRPGRKGNRYANKRIIGQDGTSINVDSLVSEAYAERERIHIDWMRLIPYPESDLLLEDEILKVAVKVMNIIFDSEDGLRCFYKKSSGKKYWEVFSDIPDSTAHSRVCLLIDKLKKAVSFEEYSRETVLEALDRVSKSVEILVRSKS